MTTKRKTVLTILVAGALGLSIVAGSVVWKRKSAARPDGGATEQPVAVSGPVLMMVAKAVAVLPT